MVGVQTPGLVVGDTVGVRYQVLERLGQGGTADVYRVRHKYLGAERALKVLNPRCAHVWRRLLDEGCVQSQLRHPNIVEVFDVMDVGGLPALVMELIEGPDLEQWIKIHEPALNEVLTVFRGIVTGVSHAHSNGVVHRDLKPPNILLGKGAYWLHPKIADFGLAKLRASTNGVRTHAGARLGTPGHMAPEQALDSSNVDWRADLYSLGTILYAMLWGMRPFKEGGALRLLHEVAQGKRVEERSRGEVVPHEVHRTLRALLQSDPARRPADCRAVLDMLDGEPQGMPVRGLQPDLEADQEPSIYDEATVRLPPPKPMGMLWLVAVLVAAGGVGLGVLVVVLAMSWQVP